MKSLIKKFVGKSIMKILGWKIVLHGDPKVLNRCVLVVGPHTDNMEYLLGNFSYWALDKPLRVIIKDAHTKAWYGGLVKAAGGIGIDRSQRNNLVEFIADLYKKEDFSLVITPEGTRSWVPKWRKGFYQIAMKAQVPIVFASGCFKNKTIYLGKTVTYEELQKISYEELLKQISDYYKEHDITPKRPENWNPNIQ